MKNNVDNPSIPGPALQTDVTGARALDGTVYQNAGGKPRYILVSTSISVGAGVTFYSDSAANPSQAISYSQNNNLSSITVDIFLIVLPGAYYKAVISNVVSFSRWIEYQ